MLEPMKYIFGPLWGLSWVLVVAGPAYGQPNPFDAYEGQRQAEGPPAQAQAEDASCPEPVVKVVERAPALPAVAQPGQWRVSAMTTLGYTSSSYETTLGEVTHSNMLWRVMPSAGLMLVERIEVGLSPGLMVRRLAREDDEGATSVDWSLEAYGRYHLPLEGRFSFVPGLRVGVYTGSSTRDVALADAQGRLQQVNEQTSTLGTLLTLSADLGVKLTDDWGARGGLGMTGIWGRERIESQDRSFWSATYHVSFGLGVDYLF